MSKQGILRGGEALHSNPKCISGPNRVVSDGPYVESKEVIGGYYTIAVDSIEQAQEVAQDYPDYDLVGTVQIHEVVKFEQ